jgi:hypothetical protein
MKAESMNTYQRHISGILTYTILFIPSTKPQIMGLTSELLASSLNPDCIRIEI